MIMTQLWLACG